MSDRQVIQPEKPDGLEPYAGRWVAMIRGRVVGQGGTPEQAISASQASRYKELPKVVFVPTMHPLQFPPILQKVADALSPDLPVYLVGGAVRDALLQRTIHDLDFVFPGNAIKHSRQIANRLGAAFYPLDEENDTGRIILIAEDKKRITLDFSAMRGEDLYSDLEARDFTLNAMAVDVHHPQTILDPLGGVSDLQAKQLRVCSRNAFLNDPIRILRAIRQAAGFGFHILPEARELMREAVPYLPRISAERLRDELFRLLDGPRVAASVRALDMLGALTYILPELDTLKGVDQSPPHQEDVWHHTLHVVHQLEIVLSGLSPVYDPDKTANLALGMLTMKIGRYRQQLCEHLAEQLNTDRPLRPLIFLAALYHDIGKPKTRQVDSENQVRFNGHDEASLVISHQRGMDLRLSKPELERLALIVRGHIRPVLLEKEGNLPTRRAVYRFFRDFRAAGVDICLLALADFLGAYGSMLPQDKWTQHLDVIRYLLEAWWEHPQEKIYPPALINGNDVMIALNIPPGPQVGVILEAVREAQAVGQVSTREEAIVLARQFSAG